MQLLNSNIPQGAQTTRYSNKKAQDLLNLVLFCCVAFSYYKDAARGQKASFCRKLRGVKTKRSNLYPTIQKSKYTKNHATADTANS